ncbi:hypothetical protein [Haloarchaeobius sp. DFWS5]|uniref:hypothetical protein n=1 Tax=Haloarchaeobius sp. DFWS5 TaxID=3446114 RepID=UPI003EB98A20
MVNISEEIYWLLVQSVTLANIVVLTAGFVLSLVAVRGYRGAPINRMLKPMPAVFLGFLLVNAPVVAFYLYDLPHFLVWFNLVFTVGVVGAVLAAIQAVCLLTERRNL